MVWLGGVGSDAWVGVGRSVGYLRKKEFPRSEQFPRIVSYILTTPFSWHIHSLPIDGTIDQTIRQTQPLKYHVRQHESW